MKALLALLILFAVSTEAEARKRQRITVQPQGRVIAEHPYAVTYALSYMLCGFHVFSIGPQGRPAECASWFYYPQQRGRA